MASVKAVANEKFQLTVKNKLLPKTFYATFDDRAAAEQYGRQLDGLLGQGIVPTALLSKPETAHKGWTVQRCIVEYQKANSIKTSEIKLLETVRVTMKDDATWTMNFVWANAWTKKMKREDNLSPSTIRHRVGALARCIDWVCRQHPEIMVANPVRTLPRGYATYSDEDALVAVKNGGVHKRDESRNRRLESDEEKMLYELLKMRPDERMFLTLAIETSMRMRECYTLTLPQVKLDQSTISLDKTKNGSSRQVPLSSVIKLALAAYIAENRAAIKARGDILFPYWSGELETLKLDSTTCIVSRNFSDLFEEAGMEDFHFHDLRHEAICRFFLKTEMSDTEIARISGHKDPRMLTRYASLRGSELAAKLW